jgi:cell division protein FtsN
MSTSKLQSQRGSTLLGFILGLVIGLTVALGVAMYVTKVPMPFSNKNQSRSAEQDAVESQKNKDWNPNGALQSKPTTTEAGAEPNANNPAATSAPAPAVSADPLADLMKKSANNAAPAAAPTPAPAVTPQPAAPAAAAPTPAKPSGDADLFTYFVQAGAFKSAADADAQKAKLSMMGIEAKVSEREQSGRSIFRVRSGPFDSKDQAEKIKARLDASGLDAALVRVQR